MGIKSWGCIGVNGRGGEEDGEVMITVNELVGGDVVDVV